MKILGFFQGQLDVTAAVVVSQFVTGDAKQPGRKSALPAKAGDGFDGGEEGLGGQVYGLLHVTSARKVVAVDAGQVAMIQLGEGIRAACFAALAKVTGGAASQLNIIFGGAGCFAVLMRADEGQDHRDGGEF